MRIERDEDGTFRIEDEPIRIEGESAQQFLDQLSSRDDSIDAQRQRFLDESRRVYSETRRNVFA
jgi:hypothetical protein